MDVSKQGSSFLNCSEAAGTNLSETGSQPLYQKMKQNWRTVGWMIGNHDINWSWLMFKLMLVWTCWDSRFCSVNRLCGWSDTLTPNLWRQDTNNTPPVFVALWKRVFISLPSCLCAIKRRGRLWNHDADEKFSLEVLHLCDQTVSKSPETQFHLAVVLCFFFWFIF